MITIQTRQNKNGSYWCNCTVNCSDVYFEAQTPQAAQMQMTLFLAGKGISPEEQFWEEVKLYPKQEAPPAPLKLLMLLTGLIKA